MRFFLKYGIFIVLGILFVFVLISRLSQPSIETIVLASQGNVEILSISGDSCTSTGPVEVTCTRTVIVIDQNGTRNVLYCWTYMINLGKNPGCHVINGG